MKGVAFNDFRADRRSLRVCAWITARARYTIKCINVCVWYHKLDGIFIVYVTVEQPTTHPSPDARRPVVVRLTPSLSFSLALSVSFHSMYVLITSNVLHSKGRRTHGCCVISLACNDYATRILCYIRGRGVGVSWSYWRTTCGRLYNANQSRMGQRGFSMHVCSLSMGSEHFDDEWVLYELSIYTALLYVHSH